MPEMQAIILSDVEGSKDESPLVVCSITSLTIYEVIIDA